ncbi:NADPH-dependent F420 reductase [Halodesulfurarchaeum sp. HSR-GB]|uniref:NADPH-dependent F420 reductase n=1 Tax=Halodesulfurarchaeum sp. HSR-GB TaxID=3074077 RepID=UPI00286377DB|nr:NADPH-dependent F420 reductase [Halodesulfurarchaeum sp. HSR-GB]MDR5656617.1 NADPH-dependent F420 reductase [Halodesulfurarchaeum sp. HSR-GB]
MQIALLGGTGDLGAGLTLRWGRDTDHDLLVGSRDPDQAREAASEYAARLDGTTSISGFENGAAAARADIVVLAVSPYHLGDLLSMVEDRLAETAIVVTPAVGMERGEDGMSYAPPPQGSVAALVRERTPDPNPVVGAFHTLPAGRLADLDATLDFDTLVFGDRADAVAQVREVAESIDGLGTLTAGGLGNAAAVESLTPLLLTLGAENDAHGLGLKIQ